MFPPVFLSHFPTFYPLTFPTFSPSHFQPKSLSLPPKSSTPAEGLHVHPPHWHHRPWSPLLSIRFGRSGPLLCLSVSIHLTLVTGFLSFFTQMLAIHGLWSLWAPTQSSTCISAFTSICLWNCSCKPSSCTRCVPQQQSSRHAAVWGHTHSVLHFCCYVLVCHNILENVLGVRSSLQFLLHSLILLWFN